MPVLVALACGCSFQPAATEPAPGESSRPMHSIYVVSHGWHTGIVFPREELLAIVPALAERFPGGEYLEIGWGDKGFYQASEITSGITLKALLWPSDTVVHAVNVPVSAYDSFPHSEIRQLCLDAAQLESLGRFIAGSFERDPAGHIVAVKRGIYGDSEFYEGGGSFHLFNTCNKWTAKGLQSAGFDISTSSKLTASSVLGFLDGASSAQPAQVLLDAHGHCQ